MVINYFVHLNLPFDRFGIRRINNMQLLAIICHLQRWTPQIIYSFAHNATEF